MSDSPQLLDLLAALCDERLTAAQRDELDALLRTDPAARQMYVRYMHMEAGLFRLLRVKQSLPSPDDTQWIQQFLDRQEDQAVLSHEPAAGKASLDDTMVVPAMVDKDLPSWSDFGELAEPAPFWAGPRAANSGARRLPRSRWRQSGWAAAVLLGAGALAWLLHGRPSPQPAPSATVATITAEVGAKWAENVSTNTGALPAAVPLKLTAGYAQLTFRDGGNIIVEAPAQFTVESARSMQLASGKLTATVAGGGFVVTTPGSTLTDLGTEFGVEVDGQKLTHLEVFKGRVRASIAANATTTSRVLTASQAVDIPASATAIRPATPQPMAFVRQPQFAALQEPRAGESPDFTRWRAFSDQIRHDPGTVAYYTFDNQTQLLNRADATAGEYEGQIENASWTQGRFPGKAALDFNGKNSRVKVNIPQSLPRMTLAYWVDVRTLKHALNAFLVSDGLGRRSQMQCQMGARGGLIFGVRDQSDEASGWANFTAPDEALVITPGHWRFITFVYDSSANGEGRWYVDGKLVYHHPKGRESLPVVIGAAEIGNYNAAAGADRPMRALDGRIDEMVVFNRALSAAEIQAMYRAGGGQ
jgi:hypothetical protein